LHVAFVVRGANVAGNFDGWKAISQSLPRTARTPECQRTTTPIELGFGPRRSVRNPRFRRRPASLVWDQSFDAFFWRPAYFLLRVFLRAFVSSWFDEDKYQPQRHKGTKETPRRGQTASAWPSTVAEICSYFQPQAATLSMLLVEPARFFDNSKM
jgi:hypothetical protein